MPLLFSTLTAGQVEARLDERKYVVVQGPPGTGKTRMALELMKGRYGGRGRSIQFHPSTSYESFIGGLVPAPAAESLGFHFVPTPGALMQAATEAAQDPTTPYLLHIDEINRADLGKVLGEAIFLLEPRRTVEGENSKGPAEERQISLQFDFGPPFHRDFHLPENLHILGTMNSADRSIAMLDVAVRRRFAFLPLWPDRDVVEKYGCAFSLNAFDELLNLFVEFASDEALQLMPGHSYF
jgi:5-methylcytosine-specific restriction protein B